MVLLLLALSCSGDEQEPFEGDDPGECSDDADNDRDGAFDCDDSDCAGSEACGETDTGSTGDTGGPGPTDTAGPTQTTDTATPGPWTPAPGTTWQWQLQGTLDTTPDVAMYDLDLFDTPQATIDGLHADGRVVICYFSAGSWEDWRDDAGDFAVEDKGNPLDGWPGEKWLDVRSSTVRAVMQARLDTAVSKACDGVEPDNVDGYSNDSGFPLSEADQLDYNRFLATEAHARGLSIGLKNAVEIAATLEPDFDWALNESCLDYSECGRLSVFTDAGKAVFHTEYVDDRSEGTAKQAEVCDRSVIAAFSTLIKTWDLDAWGLSCW